jgi:transcriptional regulator with XRE-family HTH domain
MPDLTDVVAANVRAERARRGWRQIDLAGKLNWSIGMISDTESGKRRVGLADMPNLCRAFEVPLVELLRGADPADLTALGL